MRLLEALEGRRTYITSAALILAAVVKGLGLWDDAVDPASFDAIATALAGLVAIFLRKAISSPIE